MRIEKGRKLVQPIRTQKDIEKIYSYLEMKIETSNNQYKKNNIRNKLLIQLGMNTGLRIGDILDFRVKDFNTKNITIRDQKTSKMNSFVLHEKMYKLVLEYIDKMELRENDFLFTNFTYSKDQAGNKFLNNKPLTKQALHYVFKDIQKNCKLDYSINTHSMRKSFGYHHYKKNKDIYLLMKIFNHSDVTITQRYIGLIEDDKNKSRENFTLGI